MVAIWLPSVSVIKVEQPSAGEKEREPVSQVVDCCVGTEDFA